MKGRTWILRTWTGVGILLSQAYPGVAQEALRIERLESPIVVDGRGEDVAWNRIALLPMTVYEPTPGAAPSELTQVRLAHDGRFIYVLGQFGDSDPGGIRIHSLTRDRLNGDDAFTLVLDTFNDEENAVTFTVTPAGTRQDAAISGDAQGSGWLNTDWNMMWDAETTRGDSGWSVEVRIPFSSLRFQADSGHVRMGISASRLIARKGERHVYPALLPDRNAAYMKPSLLSDSEFSGVQTSRPLHVTPYVLGSVARSPIPGSEAVGASVQDWNTDVGLDLKYGLTSNLTLDLTVNTDFAHVEADEQQANLSRYSPFFPEKRPFFQERSGIFYFPLGGESRLFHSRRIGLSDAGNPIRLLGGARLAGRVGNWDVGALAVQSGQSPDAASHNSSVIRLRRQVLNDRSWIGTLLTSQIHADGSYNFAQGLDGFLHLGGDDYLTFNIAGTGDSEVGLARQAAYGSAWLRRSRVQGGSHFVGITYSGPRFDPKLGFELIDNYTFAGGGWGYGWISPSGSPLRSHAINTNLFAFRDNDDGRVFTTLAGASWSFQGRRGAKGSVGVKVSREYLAESFRLPEDNAVEPGTYSYAHMVAELRTAEGQGLTAGVQLQGGRFYDGWRLAPKFMSTWFASPHLQIAGEYELNLIEFPERDQGFSTHIGRVRLRTALNSRWSADGLLQLSSITDQLKANARVRFNVREGSDLWLVYNDALDTENVDGRFQMPTSVGSSLILKYSHTLR